MGNLIISLANLYRRFAYANAFEWATKTPREAQWDVLRNLIHNNRNTVFGKKHLFSEIRSISDYQKNVPLGRYASFEPYIWDLKSGKDGILTKEKPILYGVTSGTTGKPKLCPITKSFVKDYQKNWEIWMSFAYEDHPNMFDGKILTMISPEVEGFVESGTPYGAISGMIVRHQSRFISSHYAVPYDIFCIKNYDARYYALLRFAIEQDITWLVTPNPSMVLMLAKKAMHFRDSIINDIENGTLSKDYPIEDRIRKVIEPRLKPNPERARKLSSTEFIPKNYWPNLALIGCWKEGSLPLYLKMFPRYYGQAGVRDIGLISTEGHSSIPIGDEGGQGVLAVGTHFFEFMPVNSKKALTVAELEVGKEYFLILTTSAGLYRYFTNDIVKVVGYYNRTPMIEFSHKGEHVTSITGEKLTEWQVVNAVRKASHALAVSVYGFTAVANAKKGRYEFLMEFHVKPRNPAEFIKVIDEELKGYNIEYRSKRDSGRLRKPSLKILEEGSYHRLHRKKSETNGHDAQVKITSLTDDPSFERNFKATI